MGTAIPLLTDRVYERIRHDVISCSIAPGAEISETQLCSQYKLGKAPVRMAAGKVDTLKLQALDETCRAGYQPGDQKSTSRFLDAKKAFQWCRNETYGAFLS